ncbi:MAG: hypothetical protein QNJ54_06670 [Prochloraceae cyanobacterium]|nr:hypothetical protein [Prochloraceae cyanobacterium]
MWPHQLENFMQDFINQKFREIREIIDGLKSVIKEQSKYAIDGLKPVIEEQSRYAIDELKPVIKEQSKYAIDELKPVIENKTNIIIGKIEPVLNQKIDEIIEINNKEITQQITDTIKQEIEIIIETKTNEVIDRFTGIINEKTQEIFNHQALGFMNQQFMEINNKLYLVEFYIFKEKLAELNNQSNIDLSLLNQELDVFIIPLMKSSNNLRNLVITINDFRKLNVSDDIFNLLKEPIIKLFEQSKQATELLYSIDKKIDDKNGKLKIALIELNNINYNSVIIQELVTGNNIDINNKLDVGIINRYKLDNYYNDDHTYNNTYNINAPTGIAVNNETVIANEITGVKNQLPSSL